MSTAATAFNFGSVLDKTMDQIEDAPEYGNPPDGTHTFKILECKQVQKGESPAIRFKYEYLATVELANPGDAPPAVGSICTEQFGVTEQGLPYLKKHVKDAWDKMPGASLGEVIASLENQLVHITSQGKEFDGKDGRKLKGWRSIAMILA